MFASPERVEYRLKVFFLLKENKDNKYPAFADFYKTSKEAGTLTDALFAMFMICDRYFADNMTISTCANRVEEITLLARQHAERLFAQYLKDVTAGETKH